MKGTTGIGVHGVQRRQPCYMPGLCVVKLRRQKDTRPLVCNILKPGEINYPGALMNYELCLRSSKRFITWKSFLEYGERHLIFLPPSGLFRFVGNNCIFCNSLDQQSKNLALLIGAISEYLNQTHTHTAGAKFMEKP